MPRGADGTTHPVDAIGSGMDVRRRSMREPIVDGWSGALHRRFDDLRCWGCVADRSCGQRAPRSECGSEAGARGASSSLSLLARLPLPLPFPFLTAGAGGGEADAAGLRADWRS